MELQSLQQNLSEQLKKQNFNIEKSDVWCVPVHKVLASYKPVVRTKMDILMKMLLISIQKAKFTNANTLSEILLVEELFIQDLLTKMQKTGLIEKQQPFYQLTEKGRQQLVNGVFEEDQDLTTAELLYSPTHQLFLNGELDTVLDFEDFPSELFRYQVQVDTLDIDEKHIVEELRNVQNDDEELEEPKVSDLIITSIESIEDVQINDVPCIEFLIHDEKRGTINSRIWNTLIGNWDATLQKLVEKMEMSEWEEKINNKK